MHAQNNTLRLFQSRVGGRRGTSARLERSEAAFFVAPRPLTACQVCRRRGLPPAGPTGRCARPQDLPMEQRPAQVQCAAERNDRWGGGRRPRPTLQAPRGLLLTLAARRTRRPRSSTAVRAHAPHPPLRAHSHHARAPGQSHTLAPPSASLASSVSPFPPRPCRPCRAPRVPSAPPALHARPLALRAR